MADNELDLYFKLAEGQKADLEIISAAAIAWVETLRAAAKAVDPLSDIKVELISADEGSLNFRALVDWFERNVEPRLERFERGKGRLPRTRRLLLGVVPFIIITGAPTYDFYFGEDDFTEEDRKLLHKMADAVLSDTAVETSRRKFFRTIERDRSVTAVQVRESPRSAPLITVPRDQFPEAGGLWVMESDGPPEQTSHPVLEVVLVKPALVKTPRAWTFKPEGLPEFDAVMRDPAVLNSMESGLPEKLRAGIPMTIRLEVKEEQIDGQWRLKRGGRSVVRVLSPRID